MGSGAEEGVRVCSVCGFANFKRMSQCAVCGDGMERSPSIAVSMTEETASEEQVEAKEEADVVRSERQRRAQ